MKTKADYHKKVLGLSLSGMRPPHSQGSTLSNEAVPFKTEVKKEISNDAEEERVSFLFYCSPSDYEMNKSFIGKILAAVKKDQTVLMTEASDVEKINPKEVFVFGDNIELLGIKVQSFPSFTDIAQDPSRKAALWSELKKRI